MRALTLAMLPPLLCVPLYAQEPEPTAEHAPAPTQIRGTLVGADGQPMELAHVSLYPLNRRTAIKSTEVGQDGSYVLEFDTTGIFSLWFTGVHHLVQTTALLITSPGDDIAIDARLGKHDFRDDISEVSVIGDFNNFSFQSEARKMEQQEDGTYAIEIEVEEDTLAYQLINVSQTRSFNGTQSDRYIYDGDGDYRSVIDVQGGITRIVFDPNELVRSEVEPFVRFQDPASLTARYADFRQQMVDRRTQFFEELSEMREADASREEQMAFQKEYDWSPNHALIDSALAATTEAHLRATLYMTYLSETIGIDSVRARMALAEIEPGSPAWTMGPNLVQRAIYSTRQPDVYEDYTYAVLREQQDDDLKAGLLLGLLGTAHSEEKKTEEQVLYTWLVAEYPESFEARYARAEYAPDRAIQVGKPVPEFDFASLEDSTVAFSSASMTGKTYLIDFWAVWCGPCIGELPYLHAAYDKYKEDGFTILSFSFDSDPSDVVEFREEGEWPMPWLHAFVPEGFGSDLADRFQVLGIPKLVLVGEDGSIIATERDLRGERLDETLAELFGREPTATEDDEKPKEEKVEGTPE